MTAGDSGVQDEPRDIDDLIQDPEDPRFWTMPADNEEAWQRYGRLVLKVSWMQKKYVETVYREVYRADDLLGSVWLTFRHCLDLFDPSLGFRFSTYFFNARSREVRAFVRSDSMRASLRIRTSVERYSCELNADSHEQDFAMYRIPELDESWTEAIIDLFEDTEALWVSLLRELMPREKEIVSHYYKDGWTLGMIAEKFNITRERVRQVRDKGLLRMRRKIEKLTEVASLFGEGWDGTRTSKRRKLIVNSDPSKPRPGRLRTGPRKPSMPRKSSD